MAGDKGDIIPQRPELAGDRIEQVLMVAQREVGAADGAGEQHIADEGETRWPVEKDDMAGRVTGAVDYLQLDFAEASRVAIFQPAGGSKVRAGTPKRP